MRNEWWDDECRSVMNEKNTASLQRRTRGIHEYYSQKRRDANEVCRQKKKIWLNNKIKQIEESHKQNNARKFFKDIKSFQGEKSIGVLACKDEDGKLISEQKRILERWKQYFRTLMKTGKKFEGNKGKETSEVNESILPPPTYLQTDNIITS
jgi:hypothetical protein